ncbi:ion transporter [Glaciecola sp. KUL10]|uniref:ion transporter n=1 Tax=Glaciecola sp. (strain KUL10) TaxID=2161813 RepID=UPI000D7888C8|nr:ion transporter [Glaciecola sp. KUL10]GBL03317.1 ion transport protein [Glaciecola sp. KUL10]
MKEKQTQINILDRPLNASIIAGLIVLSVVAFAIETIPNLSNTQKQWLLYTEYFFVAIFTLEYVYRLLSESNKRAFLFSFYGIVDLLAILPFYIASGVDLRSIRLLRLIRLIRLLKLARYNRAISRINRALYIAKDELVVYVFASFILLFLSAVGIFHFEHQAQPTVFKSLSDCLWWAVTSFTTVGYGDMYPITIGGRLFTFFVLMIGMGLVAVPTGIFATALAQARRDSNLVDKPK